jgi:hypothetical protein
LRSAQCWTSIASPNYEFFDKELLPTDIMASNDKLFDHLTW